MFSPDTYFLTGARSIGSLDSDWSSDHEPHSPPYEFDEDEEEGQAGDSVAEDYKPKDESHDENTSMDDSRQDVSASDIKADSDHDHAEEPVTMDQTALGAIYEPAKLDRAQSPTDDQVPSKPVLLKMSFKAGDAKHSEMPDNKVEDEATFAARPWETTNFTVPFLMALRSSFAEKFNDVNDLGPQDIEEGVISEPPSIELQTFMCRLLTLAANRVKTVDYPQYNRPLADVVDRLSPTRGDPAWSGQNPMPQGKKFVELDWQDRLRLLHCLGEWALQESKYCRDLIESHYSRKHRPNPLAFNAIGTDDRKHSYYLFKGRDTPFRLFIQTDPARTPSQWYAIASTIEELRALIEDLRATSCFTQRGKQLLKQLDQVVFPECERSCAVRAKVAHNKERATRERYRKQAAAHRLMAQHAETGGMSRTRGKPRVDYNTMLEGGRQEEDDEGEEEEPQRSFSGRLLKRKRDELPSEAAGTPSKLPGERSLGPGEVVDGGYFGLYDFDVRSPEQVAADEAARERMKLKLSFKRWNEILTKEQQKLKKKQEERERKALLKPKVPRKRSSPLVTLPAPEPVALRLPERPPSQHVLVIGSTGVDLSNVALSPALLQTAAQHCQKAKGFDIWLHLPPALVGNPRGFFGRLQGMLAQLYLAAGHALKSNSIDTQQCPVTVIIAGWAGYDLATENIEWLYACCREEDRGHMARFATKSRHKLQYVQLIGGNVPTAPETATPPHLPGSDLQLLAKSTPGGSYLGPLPPQMNNFAGVAVQGTFDHLHQGHKILLTCAAILSTQTVFLGILDDPAAQRLAVPHAALVQPLAVRIHEVATFLSRVKRRVSVHVSPLAEADFLGPAGSELAVQALVVSKETESLCGTVAGRRINQSLPLLSNYVTDVVGETEICVQAGVAAEQVDWAVLAEKKVSSRHIRERLASSRRKIADEGLGEQAQVTGSGHVVVQAGSLQQTSLVPSLVPHVPEMNGFVPSFQRIGQDVLMENT